VRQGNVQDFFHDLEETAGDILPTWNGELYFELHRGTYTSQGRNKRANRKSEFLLHDTEFLAVQASLLDPDYIYPFPQLQEAWQLVCLNQFHDIIPGSSIHEVYVDSQRDYRRITELATTLRAQALEAITRHVAGDLLLINTTSASREDLAFWPTSLPPRQQLRDRRTDELVPLQRGPQGTWIAAGALAQASTYAYDIVEGDDVEITTALTVTERSLENRFIRVTLNADGDITSIFDKVAAREILPQGKVANQFQAFEDRPINWDAWDIDIFYDDKHWLAEPAQSIVVKEQGPLYASIEIRRRVLHSDYIQTIALSFNSPRLDITTSIDWRERHILLKSAFPVEILSPVATYEIQWGNVQRPTHRNTSWDWARFETCAQKWVDLSEGDYGVSLLNDCKYGYDIHDNVIRVSLLRSPTMPDPEADQGEHTFTYSVLPHQGPWNETTIHAAYQLNDPIIVAPLAHQGDSAPAEIQDPRPLFSLDAPNIVIETVKKAEDNDGIIVRLYECQRRRGQVTLTTAFDLKAAWHVNILEETKHELPCDDRRVTFSVHPYEIVTLRLLPSA
jgi:alpha-mannosidase